MGVLDILVPLRCAVCAALGEPLCPTCAYGLVPLVPPVCERCGAPGAWPVRRCAECAGRRLGFTSARAAIVYDIRAKALVNAWKEHGRRDLARVAATIVAATLPRPSADLLTFVPSDAGRLLTRGHGPAERLAREIGRLWGLRTRTLLIRTRSVSRQRVRDRSLVFAHGRLRRSDLGRVITFVA